MTQRTPLHPAAAVGLVLLALWLGWVGSAFAALWTPQRANPAHIATLVQRVRKAHPGLLPGRLCAGAQTAWQQVQAVLAGHGGTALAVPEGQLDAAGIEMLVLDRSGQPVYAGPLQPLLPSCGRGITLPEAWLPGLIDGAQPPLFLSPVCSCR
jgi:hypothetical protein